MNIPIYRAKRIDRDKHIEGFLIKSFGAYYIVNDKASKICDSEGGTVLGYDISEEYADAFEIDPTTLAIHFPYMLAEDSDRYDSYGLKDLRVFASLQVDGKGGDILEVPYEVNDTETSFTFNIKDINIEAFDICKIKGIQQ